MKHRPENDSNEFEFNSFSNNYKINDWPNAKPLLILLVLPASSFTEGCVSVCMFRAQDAGKVIKNSL